MSKPTGGRPVIYGPKNAKVQVRALTKEGGRILNSARRVVKAIAKWPGKVSDGDVIDYILRSWFKSPKHARDDMKK